MKPQIGEIVLFKIDPSDFGIWRPLIVTFVHDDGTVDGELILNPERDRRREWPAKKLFWGLSDQHRTTEVRNVKAGDGVGDYATHFNSGSVAGLLRGLSELTRRVVELEAAVAEQQKKEESRGKLQGAPPRMPIPEKRTK